MFLGCIWNKLSTQKRKKCDLHINIRTRLSKAKLIRSLEKVSFSSTSANSPDESDSTKSQTHITTDSMLKAKLQSIKGNQVYRMFPYSTSDSPFWFPKWINLIHYNLDGCFKSFTWKITISLIKIGITYTAITTSPEF